MADKIELNINGKTVVAQRGERLIDVAKREGDYIPRFCYHPKLSVVASCRMCLVEIEGMGKAQPACATYVTDNMVVKTQSPKALDAQKAIMQFLLINHPLNCPICDQGGECELQDTAMGYGDGVSEFTEDKRVVEDEDLGPLVATEMSLCIHCTRCVRFGKEIAGVSDLGLVGRSDSAQISTYLNTGLRSELSGNMIDLCPVGALTSKPFKFKGRSWGFKQHLGISPHDCVGSHLSYHTVAKGYDHLSDVVRILPVNMPDLNETWLSDRDRFGYEGINAPERLQKPLMKKGNRFEEIGWEEALTVLSHKLSRLSDEEKKHSGLWISNQSTTEEGYAAQALFRQLGIQNIDHRLDENTKNQDQWTQPSDITPENITNYDTIIMVGSNIRYEQPMLALRVKQAYEKGAEIHSLGAVAYDWYTPSVHHSTSIQSFAKSIFELFQAEESVSILKGKVLFILGEEARIHPQADSIKAMIYHYCQNTSANYLFLSPGPNTVGLHAVGCVPHHTAFAEAKRLGLSYQAMLDQPMSMMWLHQVDPMMDVSDPQRAYKMLKASFVVATTAYATPGIKDCADLILPVCPIAETPGSFINYLGQMQTFKAATRPKGEAKMGYSLFQIVGQLCGQKAMEEYALLHNEVRIAYEKMQWIKPVISDIKPPEVIDAKWMRLGLTSHVRGDLQIRHAQSLQAAYPVDEGVYCQDEASEALFKSHLPMIQTSTKVAPNTLLYERGTNFYGASVGEVGIGETE